MSSLFEAVGISTVNSFYKVIESGFSWVPWYPHLESIILSAAITLWPIFLLIIGLFIVYGHFQKVDAPSIDLKEQLQNIKRESSRL